MTPERLPSETEQKDELLFVLHHRDAPTVVFLECNSYAKREELARFLRQNLTEYQFHDIDVTRFSVISLLRVLTENLPPEIVNSTPVQYIVNVYGLENSPPVSEDGRIRPSLLTAQLNLERELLFRNVPYIIIIWADHFFFQTLQRESPDFWSWVVYRFRFEGTDAADPENAPPLPPERLPQQGNIAERQQRIQELETTYNQLNLDTSDKKRLLKDKVTILKLLAEEYTEAFRYDEAQTAYENAIAIAGRMQESNFLQGNLYFYLAGVQIAKRQFKYALASYEKSLSYAEEDSYGFVHHQIGQVYQYQQQWAQALTNYQLALNWKQKTDNTYALGKTYHQIGTLYAAQQQWTQALTNYQLALEWKQRMDNARELGSTYHQIGMLYEEQHQWEQALTNYQLALNWDEQTGNTFQLGNTYHHIGKAYEEQRQWEEALTSYQLALYWKQKTGNTYMMGNTYHHIGIVYQKQQQLTQALTNYQMALNWQEKMGNTYMIGSTYHQIGMVHEGQNKLEEALKWYHLAIDNMIPLGREDQLSIVQASLARVESQLTTKQHTS